MIKNIKIIIAILLLVGCKSPGEKIKQVILYNDSVGYWNYEWPRDRAAYYGFTFKLTKDGKISKYSYAKIENKRWLFSDYGVEPSFKWGVANDSVITLMHYNSKIKIIKYNYDTIWMYDSERKRNTMLLKVKGDLNIER